MGAGGNAEADVEMGAAELEVGVGIVEVVEVMEVVEVVEVEGVRVT